MHNSLKKGYPTRSTRRKRGVEKSQTTKRSGKSIKISKRLGKKRRSSSRKRAGGLSLVMIKQLKEIHDIHMLDDKPTLYVKEKNNYKIYSIIEKPHELHQNYGQLTLQERDASGENSGRTFTEHEFYYEGDKLIDVDDHGIRKEIFVI